MDCKEIASISVQILQSEILGHDASSMGVRSAIYELYRTIFQLQFEMRGLIIDFESINDLSNRFVRDLTQCTIWSEYEPALDLSVVVDRTLHNWTCDQCGQKIYCERHVRETCAQSMIRTVMWA
jgi:hypothetical protein